MDTFVHNPTEVEAIQVAKPWSGVQRSVPFARKITHASGALAYFSISTPGCLDTQSASPGDWIVKLPSGEYQVLTEAEFEVAYRKKEANVDGHAGTD